MPKAHVNPAELRRFAQDLKRFNSELETLLHGLHSRLLNLEKTWDDQEQRKFMKEFEQSMRMLKRFLDSSGLHVPFLLKKARIIEDYLQQH